VSAPFLALFSFWSVLVAGQSQIRVELVPDNPGPYAGGEVVTVDVWLHSEMTVDVRLPRIQFDFEKSDPELVNGPLFAFDFSTLLFPEKIYYATYPELPRPKAENTILCFCPEEFLLLPVAGSLHVGSVPVLLPSTSRSYRLDALNRGDSDPQHGALIFIDYSPLFGGLYANAGEVTGGYVDFVVNAPPIPTVSGPALLVLAVLLGCAGWWIASRSRASETTRWSVWRKELSA